MKLTRKLIPAFAMLLVSAVLMSTASFAWFSMNKDVEADGIMVTATAPAALWISRIDANTNKAVGYTTNIEFERSDNKNYVKTDEEGNGPHAIAPVTMKYATSDNGTFLVPDENTAAGAANWKFYSLTQAEMSKVDEDGVHPGIVFDDDAKTADKDERTVMPDAKNFFVASFLLKLEGTKGVDVKSVSAKVTVSNATKNGDDEIFKSLRMAIVTAGGTASSEGYAVYDWSKLGESATKTFMNIAAQEEITVYFYVWFEGQDTDCKNANAQNYNDFQLDIDFQTGAAV